MKNNMNYLRVFEGALRYANDPAEMKAYCIREQKKAESEFYTKESFYNGLLKISNATKKHIETALKERTNYLNRTIDNIDSYVAPPPQISDIPFDEIDMKEYRATKKSKTLKDAKDELKAITINDYKDGNTTFANVLLFEKIVNELYYKYKPEKPINYKAKHHALAYLFDCHANGRSCLEGQKTELEKIGSKRSKHKINGNTFYKAFNKMVFLDLNVESNLRSIAGEDWRNIILELSENPDVLNEYLKTKQL